MTRLALMPTSLLALLTLVGGCSNSPPAIVPAEGTVTLNGKPLAGAEVRFVPMIQGFGGEYIASAITDESGHFELKVLGQSGACAVENKITVSEGPMPDDARGMSAAAQMKANKFMAGLKNRPIPPAYGNLAQSPLTMTVTPDRKEYNLQLNR
ncbi:transthyretin-like family protein [Zavarzinella formosa]|uniref:hypothetical protein n=1 Tax=Zavarzinella formosa TaxID=360055 RepID=UPI0002D713FD|nr:hypothetical protein [Zavarzinella formosa]